MLRATSRGFISPLRKQFLSHCACWDGSFWLYFQQIILIFSWQFDFLRQLGQQEQPFFRSFLLLMALSWLVFYKKNATVPKLACVFGTIARPLRRNRQPFTEKPRRHFSNHGLEESAPFALVGKIFANAAEREGATAQCDYLELVDHYSNP